MQRRPGGEGALRSTIHTFSGREGAWGAGVWGHTKLKLRREEGCTRGAGWTRAPTQNRGKGPGQCPRSTESTVGGSESPAGQAQAHLLASLHSVPCAWLLPHHSALHSSPPAPNLPPQADELKGEWLCARATVQELMRLSSGPGERRPLLLLPRSGGNPLPALPSPVQQSPGR